jgi:hypothetical protein
MAGINDLPDELIEIILSFCEGYLTLGSICHVNRRLRRIAGPRLDRVAWLELRVFGTGWVETCELMHFQRGRPDQQALERPSWEPTQDAAEREHWKYGDVKLAWLPILRLLDDFCECPTLFRYIHHVAISFRTYPKPDMPNRFDGRLCLCTDCALLRQHPVTDRMRSFGQRALNHLGIQESIDAWDTPDGWTALFLLLCPNLESLYITNTDHPKLVRSRMEQIVGIARRQTPAWSLGRLKYVYSRDHEFWQQGPPPMLWTFLDLPSVQACDMPRPMGRGRLFPTHDFRNAYLNISQPGVIKHAQQGAMFAVSIPLLHRKALSLPVPLRKFRHLTFADNKSFHRKEGRVNFYQLSTMLADFHDSLEELWIACPSYLVAPPKPEAPGAERGTLNNSDANIKQYNPNSQLGSLAPFERLDTICVPVFTMFHDQNTVPLIDLIPKNIEILEFSGEVNGPEWQTRFFYELEDLIQAKYERFPKLRLLRLHGYVLPYEAVEMCRLYGITLRMDKGPADRDGNDHPYLV